MTLFVLFVLVTFFAMHFYVFWRLFDMFGCRRRWGFWSLTILGAISLIGSRILESYIDHILIEIFFVAAGYWLGVMWLLFCSMLIYEVIKYILPHQPRTGGKLIIAVVCIAALYATLNARRVTVNTINLTGPEAMRIVQWSDVHIGSMNAAYIQKIVEKTNSLDPDMILITGDLVDHLSRSTQKAMARLTQLNGPVYFVSGNHEYYTGRKQVLDELERLGVTLMDHRVRDLGSVQLIGLPDMTDPAQAEGALLALPYDRNAYSILMFHRPMNIDFLAQAGIHLTLVGHTHRGQIFPFNLIVRFFERPLYGLHQQGDSFLYVTSGTGLWGPRMRLGTNNEIVVIDLKPE